MKDNEKESNQPSEQPHAAWPTKDEFNDDIEAYQTWYLYKHFTNIHKAIVKQKDDEIERLREALESISSKHKPRHETKEYWLSISHEQCAEVLATDTKIARAALGVKEG